MKLSGGQGAATYSVQVLLPLSRWRRSGKSEQSPTQQAAVAEADGCKIEATLNKAKLNDIIILMHRRPWSKPTAAYRGRV